MSEHWPQRSGRGSRLCSTEFGETELVLRWACSARIPTWVSDSPEETGAPVDTWIIKQSIENPPACWVLGGCDSWTYIWLLEPVSFCEASPCALEVNAESKLSPLLPLRRVNQSRLSRVTLHHLRHLANHARRHVWSIDRLSQKLEIQSLWVLIPAVLCVTLGQPLAIPSSSASTSVKGEEGCTAGKY